MRSPCRAAPLSAGCAPAPLAAPQSSTPLPTHHPTPIPPLSPPRGCRGLGFLTNEELYPFTGQSGACDTSRLETIGGASKYELAEGAYEMVQPWSAAGLREVRAAGCRW